MLGLVGLLHGRSTGEHAARGLFGQVGQARCLVYRVPDHRVFKAVAGADVTGHHRASCHANARLELQVLELLVQFARCGKGVPGNVIQGQRSAKHSQRCIALKLVDDALVPVHTLHHAVEELIERLDHVLRIALRGEAGGANHVHKQHRHIAGLAT